MKILLLMVVKIGTYFKRVFFCSKSTKKKVSEISSFQMLFITAYKINCKISDSVKLGTGNP